MQLAVHWRKKQKKLAIFENTFTLFKNFFTTFP